jgi:predicted O-methyltransferase YrrM
MDREPGADAIIIEHQRSGERREEAVDDTLRAIIDELHRHGAQHDAGKVDRLQRLRNVEPDTAQVLAALVRATGARRLLEIGTSNGYSTLWLADAVRSVGGGLVSVDIDAARSALAAHNLDRAGLHELVELRVEDAAVSLRETADESWDMIFLDAERPAYAGYWPELVRVLRPGGLLAVDNVLSHADQVDDFRSLIRADERVSEALVPTGAGLLLVVRNPTQG